MYIEINNKVKFCNTYPYSYEDVHTVDELEVNNVISKLLREDINENECRNRKLEDLLKTNKDFFQEGMALSHTDETQHKIVAKPNNPLYFKRCRYPQIVKRKKCFNKILLKKATHHTIHQFE